MAVVTLEYTRDKQAIKANLRYFTHRSGRNSEKMTRDIFTNTKDTDKQEFYRHIKYAGPGTVFFKFIISPDPRSEDTLYDLDLRHITRRMIRKMEKAIGRNLSFFAAIHDADHTQLRHVHGIFIARGRLSKEQFWALQEVARSASTREALLQRQARDLIRQSTRYRLLSRNRQLAIHGRGGGRVPKVQPGCRTCRFGEFGGIPAYKTHCPICRTSLRDDRQVRFRLHPREWGWR